MTKNRGRPPIYSKHKKVGLSISLSKELLEIIDKRIDNTPISRSEFITSFLESFMFSDIAYCSYMEKHSRLEAEFWSHEMKKQQIKKEIKKDYMEKNVFVTKDGQRILH